MTVEVIENCSRVSEQCYRVDHFQSVSARNPDNRRQEEVGVDAPSINSITLGIT